MQLHYAKLFISQLTKRSRTSREIQPKELEKNLELLHLTSVSNNIGSQKGKESQNWRN